MLHLDNIQIPGIITHLINSFVTNKIFRLVQTGSISSREPQQKTVLM